MVSIKHRISNVLAWAGFPFLPFVIYVLLFSLSFMIIATVTFVVDPKASPDLDCYDFKQLLEADIDRGQVKECYLFAGGEWKSRPMPITRRGDWIESIDPDTLCRDESIETINMEVDGDARLDFCMYRADIEFIREFLRGPSDRTMEGIIMVSIVWFTLWFFCCVANYVVLGSARIFPWRLMSSDRSYLKLDISHIVSWTVFLIWLLPNIGLFATVGIIAMFTAEDPDHLELVIMLSFVSLPYILAAAVNYNLVGSFRILPWKPITSE